EAGVKALGFRVLGRPQLGIIAFTHDEIDPMAVWGKLFERGWFTSLTTEPPGLHLMLSPFHLQVADTYLADLAWAAGEVRKGAGGAAREARYSCPPFPCGHDVLNFPKNNHPGRRQGYGRVCAFGRACVAGGG